MLGNDRAEGVNEIMSNSNEVTKKEALRLLRKMALDDFSVCEIHQNLTLLGFNRPVEKIYEYVLEYKSARLKTIEHERELLQHEIKGNKITIEKLEAENAKLREIKSSVNSLTAENSRLLRKIARMRNKKHG